MRLRIIHTTTWHALVETGLLPGLFVGILGALTGNAVLCVAMGLICAEVTISLFANHDPDIPRIGRKYLNPSEVAAGYVVGWAVGTIIIIPW
jgi:hypothetical protein